MNNKWLDLEKSTNNTIIDNFKNYEEVNKTDLLNKIKNGRIDILGNDIQTSSSFPLYEESITGNMLYKSEALKTILTTTDKLYQTFFSPENIKLIQSQFKKIVYEKSKHVIQNQSDNSLHIIMRSIYLQYAKHNNTNIKAQVRELNQIIYNYSIPNILSNIELYKGYKKTISNAPVPLSAPIYTSSSSEKANNIDSKTQIELINKLVMQDQNNHFNI